MLKRITSFVLAVTLILCFNMAYPVSSLEETAQESSSAETISDEISLDNEAEQDDSLPVEDTENVDTRALFEELRGISKVRQSDLFSEYSLDNEDAYEYYTAKRGDTFTSMLIAAKNSLSKKDLKEYVSVSAPAGDSVSDNISWSVTNKTLTISGSGEMTDYNWLNDQTKAPWSSYRDSVTKVIISDGITHIGAESFKYFSKLKSVSVPSSVTSIGNSAFSDCSALESVTLPDKLEEIDDYAFQCCESLTSVVFPDSLKRLGYDVFLECRSLSSAYIGSGLTVIAGNPFGGCMSLKEIKIGSNSNFSIINGALFDENMVLIAYPPGRKVSSYTIPSGTTAIGRGAFRGDSYYHYGGSAVIDSVTIPDSVTSIGDYAFEYTMMSSVTIGNNVEEISYGAFQFNDFKTIKLPDSLTRIDRWAISGCVELTSINIPANVVSIGYGAFGGNDIMTAITVDPSNKYFKAVDGVLYSKDGKTAYCYPDGKTNTTYKMPDTVEHIEREAFYEIPYLNNITFSNNLKTIGFNNFLGCNIEEINLPDSLVQLESNCFSFSDNLKKVTVGSSVAMIEGSFQYCDNLKEVYFLGNLPDDYFYMLYDCPATVYYPQNDSTWNKGKLTVKNTDLVFKPWDSSTHYRTNISESTVSLSTSSYTYDGTAKKPSVTVKYGSNTLTNGVDYELAYSNNVNAGTASIKIDGIGDCYGTVTKTFTINKASQSLSASVSLSSIKVNGTAAINASGYGTISYKSNNESVATVSSSGVITGKKEGTATITVNAAGNTNYNSASKTVSITVTPTQKIVTYDDLTYSFSNTWSSFGYDDDYKIPYERYLMFFTPTQAQKMHSRSKYWHGSCGGFAGSTLLFNDVDCSLSIKSFNSTAKSVSDLKTTDKSSSLGINVQQLLESLQVGQSANPVCSENSKNTNDYNGLVSAVKKCSEGGMPVYIAVWRSDGGHAIVGYKYEYVSSTEDRIYVYDCNRPNDSSRYVSLYKSGGKYTGFKYVGGYTYTSSISYVTADAYCQLWDGRNTDSMLNDCNMTINSENFKIKNAEGNTVAEMKDGNFKSTSDDIYELMYVDMENTGHNISLPTDSYSIESSDDAYEVPLELTVVNANQSASVKTQSNEVELFVDDSQNTNLVNVSGKSGEKYEIVFNSDTVYTTDNSEVVFSGKSKGKDVTVGMSYGEYINEGYTDSGIRVEDTAINLDNFSANNISNCNFKLEKSSYICTGAPVEADFTITDSYGNALTPGVDYTVVYNSNVKPGTATAAIYGINNYNGSIDFEFKIKQASISSCQVSLDSLNYVFTGEEIKPEVTASLSGAELIENEDYTVEYSNNVNVGTAKATVSGKGGYTGSLTLEFYISPADVADCEISLDKTTYIYTGNEIKPTVNVKLNGVTLTLGKQYTVEYKNNVNIGRATVIVKGISDLSGEITKTFIISSGEYICGDVNSDGEVNAKDRMTLTRYLAKWSGYENIDMTAADVNNDGQVNAKDRMILTRHLAKWQGYDFLPYKNK